MTDPRVREITDSAVLAALSHPLRRRLIDVLRVDGPATASRLAEATGQAVGNVSHHIKTLAAADLVEPAPELARDKRERWWRVVSAATRWSTRSFGDEPGAEAIATAANQLNLERQVGFVRAWLAASDDDTWPTGPFSTDHWLSMTDNELAVFAEEVIALHRRWAGREIPDDGKQRRPVFAFARAVPATP